jgi:hypothetical protein
VLRRLATRLIGDPAARLVTGPAAFLIGGVIDVMTFAGSSLRGRYGARRDRP